FLQQWYALSDPLMEEALSDTAVMRRLSGINSLERIPDETTILNFRRLLETHGLGAKMLEAVNAHPQRQDRSLRAGTIVDATIIHAPSFTKNADKARDPEMHQTRKGNQWYFGMKAHIGINELSGLVHHVTCTATNVGDVTVTHELLNGKEDCVLGDSGYTGAESRPEPQDSKAAFLIGRKRGTLKAIKKARDRRQHERWGSCKASMHAKVEHPLRVIKHQFGYTRGRYCVLAKNGAQVLTLFALSNLWVTRRQFVPAQGMNPPGGAQRRPQNPISSVMYRTRWARDALGS
ncbi:IS5 family transposase, partial [Stenotrophomonas sp. GZD-301]|uniref:IS5 family transposase n=1 Tax=Stenotrophomonas sp. GZD-301 TaxID=3404814 RepID=UPI003BB63ABE